MRNQTNIKSQIATIPCSEGKKTDVGEGSAYYKREGVHILVRSFVCVIEDSDDCSGKFSFISKYTKVMFYTFPKNR